MQDTLQIIGLNPHIAEVCAGLEKHFNETARLNTAIINVHGLAVDSVEAVDSIAAQKVFFSEAKQWLAALDSTSITKLGDDMPNMALIEARFIHDLEQDDAMHQGAVEGIVSASFLFGVLTSLVTQDLTYFMLFLTPLALTSPYAVEEPSPSKLGVLVYHASPEFRARAASLNYLPSPTALGRRLNRFFTEESQRAADDAPLSEEAISEALWGDFNPS